MSYKHLRDFIKQLQCDALLKTIEYPVSPCLHMTEVCDRVLKAGGPALLFSKPQGYSMPVLANIFGTQERIALAMGLEHVDQLRTLGSELAFLKQPKPPSGWKAAMAQVPLINKLLSMSPKYVKQAPCRQIIVEKEDVDLSQFPIQTCWPGDVGPLITWGVVITQNPNSMRHNLGIYRQQVIGRNKVIMRWLRHRGGAMDFHAWKQRFPDQPFPIAVALGADPATLLSAVMPLPDDLSEYAFAGLLRGYKTELIKCLSHELPVPAQAEIILEGFINPGETAEEGPFGDHTGYYNERERFPVMTIERITHRHQPIYHTTYTGRPPDEPALLGQALNELFVPIVQQQLPEIVDFYLPAEACSYRMAVVSIKKRYAGHAKRIMMGIWSLLPQFLYTKMIIVVDEDINIRDWSDVVWALSTRLDPVRDTTLIDRTPIDYLDFASPESGLGGKMGLDATTKWRGETDRTWGQPIKMSDKVRAEVDAIWNRLGL